jgi:hypothetical protein
VGGRERGMASCMLQQPLCTSLFLLLDEYGVTLLPPGACMF